MITIDKPKAIELLERAVAEKGAGYIDPATEYDECQYVKDGKPGCIIGWALHYAGANLVLLKKWDDEVSGLSATIPPPDADKITLCDVELTMDAFEAFKAAQGAQDRGNNWGNALVEAKKATDARSTIQES